MRLCWLGEVFSTKYTTNLVLLTDAESAITNLVLLTVAESPSPILQVVVSSQTTCGFMGRPDQVLELLQLMWSVAELLKGGLKETAGGMQISLWTNKSVEILSVSSLA